MAKISATMWTVTVEDRIIMGKKKWNRVKLVLSSSDGANYPSGGIPLPTTMGMVRNIDYVIIVQHLFPASGASGQTDAYHWNYIVSSHSVRGYMAKYFVPTAATGGAQPSAHVTAFPELVTTWNPSNLGTSPVMYVQAVGW